MGIQLPRDAAYRLDATGTAPASAATGSTRKLPPIDQTVQRVKTQLIVRFKAGVTSAQANAEIQATGGTVRKSLSFQTTKLAVYGSEASAAKALKTLKADASVLGAFYNQRVNLPPDQSRAALPDNPLRQQITRSGKTAPSIQGSMGAGSASVGASVVSSDSLRSYQWYLDRIGDNLTPAPPTAAPIVAVIDTGMDYTSPDLSSKRVACPVISGLYCDLIEYDQDPMDTQGHGTHVAGTIGARADASGITGVSPNSKILPVRIFGESGGTDLMTIFQALDYVRLAKAKLPTLRVANMSFGGAMFASDSAVAAYNSRLGALKAAGVLPVAAAGNDSDNMLQIYPMLAGPSYELVDMPAMSPSVLAVAATDQNDARTFFSNYSTTIKINNCTVIDSSTGYCAAAGNTYTNRTRHFAPVAAPGWQVLATTPGGRYEALAGTSMASPVVAGVAARIMSSFSSLTNDQVIARIKSTGVPIGLSKGFPVVTNRVDLRRALGVSATGFSGRVVNGLTGQPLPGATVKIVVGTTTRTAVTNNAGFYTLTGAAAAKSYVISATRPGYIAHSRTATTIANQLVEPGDLSLVPVRTDGGYTAVLDFNNTASGYYEWAKSAYYPGYPWPVNPATMPFAFMDTYFGAPWTMEPSDSVEFTSWSSHGPGVLSSWPYGRVMHDPLIDMSPHQGTILRKLNAGSTRMGVKFFSPSDVAKTGAVMRLYKNAALVRQSTLSLSAAPTDGTTGTSMWNLYNLASTGAVTAPTANGHGQRSDYGSWIHRNNDIQGVPGPAAGTSRTVRVDYWDRSDVYSVILAAGSTYTFNLTGPDSSDYDLVLYGPSARSTASATSVASSDAYYTSAETITYTVPSGAGGRYYIQVYQYEGEGNYTLSRP